VTNQLLVDPRASPEYDRVMHWTTQVRDAADRVAEREDLMFCCPGFEHRVANAGQRGLGILIERTGTGFAFLLQSRGIAHEDESKVGPTAGAPDMLINIACQTGMAYCPWCGRRLEDLAVSAPVGFVALARKHEGFRALQV